MLDTNIKDIIWLVCIHLINLVDTIHVTIVCVPFSNNLAKMKSMQSGMSSIVFSTTKHFVSVLNQILQCDAVAN